MPRENGRKMIAVNRKARHDYSISDTYEAGIVLTGTEVKSLRAGRANLTDGYAYIKDGEVWLQGVHIPEYEQGTWTNHAPRRSRKLLLHRAEISKLTGTLANTGVTLIPLEMYFVDGRAKVQIGVARGRKHYDKRQAIAEREAKRETERVVGRARKGYDD